MASPVFYNRHASLTPERYSQLTANRVAMGWRERQAVVTKPDPIALIAVPLIAGVAVVAGALAVAYRVFAG